MDELKGIKFIAVVLGLFLIVFGASYYSDIVEANRVPSETVCYSGYEFVKLNIERKIYQTGNRC